MDVRCGRCGTEYDFDDALISERGTTVKCTSCGHQFKVFPRSAGSEPERWIVRTTAGHELVFTSLRDLQRAISRGQVGPDDLLSRGSAPARALRAIAELEPFFQIGAPGVDRQPRTLHGVAPPPRTIRDPASGPQVVVGGHTPWDPSGPPPVDRTLPLGQNAGSAAPRAGSGAFPRPDATLPLASNPAVHYADPAPVGATQPAPYGVSHTPPYGQPVPGARGSSPLVQSGAETRGGSSHELLRTQPAVADPRLSPTQPHRTVIGLGQTVPTRSDATPSGNLGTTLPVKSEAAPAAGGFGSTLPMSSNGAPDRPYGPTTQPVQPAAFRAPQPAAATPAPPGEYQAAEHRYSSDDLEADVRSAGLTRRTPARWVVGIVIVALLVLLGVTVGKRYLARVSTPNASSASASDERVDQALREASRLIDQGSFEDAKEQLDKAAALSDKHPAVLVAMARLESVRADIEWLRLRLLDPSNEDLVRSTHRELGARVGRAEAALAKASKSASDPTIVRATVDVLRMNGDVAQARTKLDGISAAMSKPENAYVLAALDLAEAEPAFAGVVDRLRIAASVDTDARRAQAALIYALARAGQQADAERELDKVKHESSPHPLLAELENFVGRMHAANDASKTAPSASVAAVDPRALGALDTSPVAAGGGDKAAAAEPAGDFRATLKQAVDALRAGDLARAEQLYQSALNQHPGDTEALTGLGDIAKAHNDFARAGSYYDQVLRQNPSYLPALIGSADQKWGSGDRQGALTLYHRIVEQAGTGSVYAQRAQARIKQAESEHSTSGTTQSTKTATSPPTTSAPATSAPATPQNIDTTDLKGIE